jgi:glycosyltransferase involved in cell wall biosynthesis
LRINENFLEKKLNILHVTPFFPPDKGGISNVVYYLSNLLYKNNNIHLVVSRHSSNKNKKNGVINNLIEITSIYLPGWPYSTLKSFSFPLDMGIKINSIIKHGHFDIVHVHGHHYPICWIAINSAYRHGITTVLSLHGMYALNPNVLGGKSYIEELFNKIIFKNVLSKVTVVIGGTKQIIDYAKRYGPLSNKYIVLPSGVDLARYKPNIGKKFEYRKKYNLKNNRIVVLFVGRFEEVKGIAEFANAAKTLSNQYPNTFEIVIVGEGSLESTVKSITKGLDNIHILQWQPNNTIHEIYIASDIFILPSKFEALPLTIIEAMNAHLHIIYTKVGGVEDILEYYSKKTLLSKVTSEELCNSLIKTVKKELHLVSSYDSYLYAEKFNWENIAMELNIIYKNLVTK